MQQKGWCGWHACGKRQQGRLQSCTEQSVWGCPSRKANIFFSSSIKCVDVIHKKLWYGAERCAQCCTEVKIKSV